MLFLHHTRMSATIEVQGEDVTTWSAQVHMISHITVHFYCLRAANGVPIESLSHNAVQAAAKHPGPTGACRDSQGPLEVPAGSSEGPWEDGQPSASWEER